MRRVSLSARNRGFDCGCRAGQCFIRCFRFGTDQQQEQAKNMYGDASHHALITLPETVTASSGTSGGELRRLFRSKEIFIIGF